MCTESVVMIANVGITITRNILWFYQHIKVNNLIELAYITF